MDYAGSGGTNTKLLSASRPVGTERPVVGKLSGDSDRPELAELRHTRTIEPTNSLPRAISARQSLFVFSPCALRSKSDVRASFVASEAGCVQYFIRSTWNEAL